MRAFNEQHPKVRVLVNDCAPDPVHLAHHRRACGLWYRHARAARHRGRGAAADARPPGAGVPQRPSAGQGRAWCAGATWASIPSSTVRPGYGVRPLIDGTAAEAGVALDVVNEVSFLSTAILDDGRRHGRVDHALGLCARRGRPVAGGQGAQRAARVSRDISIVIKRGPLTLGRGARPSSRH